MRAFWEDMRSLLVPNRYTYSHIKKEEEGQEKKTSRYLRAGGILGVLLSGILLLITALSFGNGGMQAIEFPAVRVMSSVSLPGGF